MSVSVLQIHASRSLARRVTTALVLASVLAAGVIGLVLKDDKDDLMSWCVTFTALAVSAGIGMTSFALRRRCENKARFLAYQSAGVMVAVRPDWHK